jgi:two-component system response regulator
VANNDVKQCFGASVKYWRHQLGISQEALAERADMHRTYICDVERGSRNVSLETIERLARALEISPFTLFLSFRRLSSDKHAARPAPMGELPDILLVADDAVSSLQSLKANVANRIQQVRDGAAALDFLFCTGAFSNRTPDNLPQLILLDLNVPKVAGIEVLQRIKANSRTRSISIIVLTTSSRSPDAVESQRLGAGTCIVKPMDFQNFSEAVTKLNLQWAVMKSNGPAGI